MDTREIPTRKLEFDLFNLKPIPHLDRWVWSLIGLGILARLVRYLLRVPLWPDEAFLAASFLDRGYLEMLTRPLAYHQMAPPGYLWLQLTAVKLLGFHEPALRIVSLLAGLASLFVFRHLAARLMTGASYLFSVGVFAVAYPAVRYSVEAKPYGLDLFVGLVLAALYVEWYRSDRSARWWWLLMLAVPVALWLSFPAVFVAGGVCLAIAWSIYRARAWNQLVPLAGLGVLLLASFVGLQAAIAPMVDADMEGMRVCWEDAFPPLNEPLRFVGWLIAALSGNITPYPVGSIRGGSTATLVCCVVAVLCLLRNRRGDLAILFLAPLALNLVAAGLHRYPFGGGVRFSLYAGSAICLLAGLGGASIAAWMSQRLASRKIVFTALVVLSLIGSGSVLRDFLRPYKTRDILRNRSFAQWFWFDKAYGAELVCLKTDWGLDFSPATFEWGVSSLYRCNQKIYSTRHRAGRPPNLDKISAEHPLRCVLFRSSQHQFDQRGFDSWLASMESRYALVAHEQYPFGVFHKDRDFKKMTYIELYEFVPHQDAQSARLARQDFTGHDLR